MDNDKTRQDVALSAARHLVSHIREAWPVILTGTNALLVTPFLNPEQLECLANHVVQEICGNSDASSQWLNALENPSVQENRYVHWNLSSDDISFFAHFTVRHKMSLNLHK